jgi:hypothetical protein
MYGFNTLDNKYVLRLIPFFLFVVVVVVVVLVVVVKLKRA